MTCKHRANGESAFCASCIREEKDLDERLKKVTPEQIADVLEWIRRDPLTLDVAEKEIYDEALLRRAIDYRTPYPHIGVAVENADGTSNDLSIRIPLGVTLRAAVRAMRDFHRK